MTPRQRSVRRRSVFGGLIAAVLLLFALPAAPGYAHAALAGTTPSAGTVLPTAPTEIVLTFTESVRPVVERIRITAPDGSRADTGTPSVRDLNLVVPVRPDAPRGTYLVSYRVISADSHPVGGAFSYSVGEVSATPGAPASTNSPSDPVVSFAVKVAKYVGFVGLVLLVGPALLLLFLYPRRLSRRTPARLVVTGAALVAAGALLELYLQIPYTSGGGLFDVTDSAAREVFGSRFGAAHLLRLGALAAIAILLRPVVTGTASVADRALLAILGLVGLSTWPLSGHPSASALPSLSVVADVAHLAAMSVWLGGLVMLFAVLLRKASDPELRAILPVWSGWAMFAITVLVLSGTAQALISVGSFDALLGTVYGRLVLAKVGLLGMIVAVAWYARRLVLTGFAPIAEPIAEPVAAPIAAPAVESVTEFEPAPAPRTRLRTGVLVEIAIAVVVLGVTAVLVQTTPANTAEANAGVPGFTTYSTELTSSLYRLRVNVEPTTTGPNTLHLYALTPDGVPLTVVEWSATAALPSARIEPITVNLLPITRDHAIGQVVLPTPGTWEIRFTLRTTEIDRASVTARVPIR